MNFGVLLRSGIGQALVVALIAGCASDGTPRAVPLGANRPANASPAGEYAPRLYVADLGKGEVIVDSYPKGKRVAVLSGFASTNGECVDANGNVFVSDGHDNEVLEYHYGSTKPAATLKDPGFYLLGCSVDLGSGDLAVAIQAVDSGPGGIAIFKRAKGKPKNYTNAGVYFPSFCGYNRKRDLFFDGSDIHGNFAFGEMTARKHTFEPISLNQSITVAGGVQWDGAHVAVGDQGVGYRGSTIYQFDVSGNTGKLVGTTQLSGSSDVIEFWIDGDQVVGPNIGSSPNVMIWKYPAGGQAIKTITGFTEPVAVTIGFIPSAR